MLEPMESPIEGIYQDSQGYYCVTTANGEYWTDRLGDRESDFIDTMSADARAWANV